jgi:hypothetical protein
MEPYEVDIANWLMENGIVGDAAAAKAVYSALDRPGQYGTLKVAREGESITVTGPAGPLTVSGAADIQALRLRLEEIINHPGKTTLQAYDGRSGR